MNLLLAGVWAVFALDLIVLLLMVREVWGAEFGDADSAYATTVIWTYAVWLCVVNLILVVSWWRDSRAGLWAALVCGALPLVWAWTMAVQAIVDAPTAPQ